MEENKNASIDNTGEFCDHQLGEVDGGANTPIIYFQCRECEYRTFDFDIGAGIVCPKCGGKLRPHQV